MALVAKSAGFVKVWNALGRLDQESACQKYVVAADHSVHLQPLSRIPATEPMLA